MVGLHFLTKLFRKEQWPEGKDIRFKILAKDAKHETIMYLSQEQMNILTAAINLGCEVLSMPIMVAMIEPKTTQGQLMS